MISRAMEMYREIRPCATKKDLGDCFTTEGNMVVFLFNTLDESTHVLTAKMV
jgi:hypothetical protein